jgi:hypothetical protein
LYFKALVEKRGVGILMQVYRTMREQRVPFFLAVQQVLGWDRGQFDREAGKYLP